MAETAWRRLTRRTNDPKLAFLEMCLDQLGIPHRRNSASAHAPIMEVPDEHFDEVLVSPLVRTRQTAQPLLEKQGRNLVVSEWLEEIRSPIWHGTPAELSRVAYAEERSRPAEPGDAAAPRRAPHW